MGGGSGNIKYKSNSNLKWLNFNRSVYDFSDNFLFRYDEISNYDFL